MIKKKIKMIETPYYHLSKVNRNGQIFLPRVPYDAKLINKYDKHVREEGTIKRICCSSSIEGCLQSSGKSKYGYAVFYVHKLIVNEDAKIITNDEILKKRYVFDAALTCETWICSPALLKCIGAIKIKKILQGKEYTTKILDGSKFTYYSNNYEYDWVDLSKLKQKYSKYYHEELPKVI